MIFVFAIFLLFSAESFGEQAHLPPVVETLEKVDICSAKNCKKVLGQIPEGIRLFVFEFSKKGVLIGRNFSKRFWVSKENLLKHSKKIKDSPYWVALREDTPLCVDPQCSKKQNFSHGSRLLLKKHEESQLIFENEKEVAYFSRGQVLFQLVKRDPGLQRQLAVVSSSKEPLEGGEGSLEQSEGEFEEGAAFEELADFGDTPAFKEETPDQSLAQTDNIYFSREETKIKKNYLFRLMPLSLLFLFIPLVNWKKASRLRRKVIPARIRRPPRSDKKEDRVA